MSRKVTKQPAVQLLKKSEIIRALNVSARDFERKLEAGLMPAPYTSIGETPRGRRWHPRDIEAQFGIAIGAL